MFWKRKSKHVAQTRRSFAVPDGQRVYAIGDIHGRDDLFADLLDKIEADHAARDPAQSVLILLGDLVDRGPDSRRVVERAMTTRNRFDTVRWLIGNHEECFLAALTGDVQRVRYFARIGGDATIRSYWEDDESYNEASYDEVAEKLPQIVPRSHADFLGAGEDMIRIGDYVFVHAGVRPGVPLDGQRPKDLRWIREEFLTSADDFGAMVVHGHSISETVEITGNRIGIDTGAYCSGALTALGLEGDRKIILQSYC